jgi:hypothetical protein
MGSKIARAISNFYNAGNGYEKQTTENPPKGQTRTKLRAIGEF